MGFKDFLLDFFFNLFIFAVSIMRTFPRDSVISLWTEFPVAVLVAFSGLFVRPEKPPEVMVLMSSVMFSSVC